MCRSLWSVLGVVPRSHLAWFFTEGLLLGPGTCQFRDPPVSVSTMLGVQVCTPVPGFLFLLFIYVYFLIHECSGSHACMAWAFLRCFSYGSGLRPGPHTW